MCEHELITGEDMQLHELVKKQNEAVAAQQAKSVLEVVAHFGSQSKLARALGVSRFVVNRWVQRGRISATAAVHIEKLTMGKFKKEVMRPDVMTWHDGE